MQNSPFMRNQSAIDDVDHLVEHGVTVYAWKDSGAYAFAKKNGVTLEQRQDRPAPSKRSPL